MRLLCYIILMLGGIGAYSQKQNPNESFYLISKDMKGTQKTEEAAYFLRITNVNAEFWTYDLYNYAGPLVYSARYKDPGGNVKEGLQTYYHPSGFIDSSGEMTNNQLQGDWTYYNDTGRVALIKNYDQGKLVSVKDPINDPDSVKAADPANEQESVFPGGPKAWQRYLQKKMIFPERAAQNHITGEVKIYFVIDTKGKIEKAGIFKSVEYSLDAAALDIIKNSPAWSPAKKRGVTVKSYKMQPMVFNIQ